MNFKLWNKQRPHREGCRITSRDIDLLAELAANRGISGDKRHEDTFQDLQGKIESCPACQKKLASRLPKVFRRAFDRGFAELLAAQSRR